MGKFEQRLELIKLTYTHARETSEAIQRARDLEAYLDEGSAVVQENRNTGAEAQKGVQNSEAKAPTDKRLKTKSDNLKSLL